MSKGFITKLPQRGLVVLSGKDRFSFLNGLISNDLSLLETQEAVYACVLTHNGKFLYDVFVTQDKETLFLECEGGERAVSLAKYLKRFKLRSSVDFEVVPEINVLAGINCTKPEMAYKDPRHTDMGWRCIDFNGDHDKQDLSHFESFDIHRLKLGIPCGSRDMVPEKSTLIESRIDRLNGISFTKGCYLGQELTARMHHRGLAKKHLYPVQIDGPPPENGETLKSPQGRLLGEMRSSCNGSGPSFGIALLKDEMLEDMQNGPLRPFRPEWLDSQPED